MTGKIQKEKNNLEEFKKNVTISYEERSKIIDECVIDVFTDNEEFFKGINFTLNTFRGMYQMHLLFGQVNDKVTEKVAEVLKQRVNAHLENEKLKRRR